MPPSFDHPPPAQPGQPESTLRPGRPLPEAASRSDQAAAHRELEVTLPVALHARPAGAVVRAAARFVATVELRHGDRRADARSVLTVLALGAAAGSTIRVSAVGVDAAAATAAVAEVLTTAQ